MEYPDAVVPGPSVGIRGGRADRTVRANTERKMGLDLNEPGAADRTGGWISAGRCA